MKTLKLLFIVLLVSTIANAQNGINYKALVKDASGNLLVAAPITVQFIILQGAALTNVYQESHTINTDANGLIIVNIGTGTTSNTFTDIAWADDEHFLNTQINTGSGFVNLGTTEFMAVPYAKHALTAANVTGLETLDEGNGIGWRLKGRNPNNYGNIGENATDLSSSTSSSTTRGAIAANSTAMGEDTTASGDYSTAMGWGTTASGFLSTAMGSGTTASGFLSTAMGSGTTASGDSSTAMGESTTASGFASTAMGEITTASGSLSTAMGDVTTASGFASTAMGSGTAASGVRSTAMGWATQAIGPNSTAIGFYNFDSASHNRLFIVGNGTSNARSNAFTVYEGTDATLATFNSGYVMIGNNSSANLVFDTNEIMARFNGNASTLFLQLDGGAVSVGGSIVHSSDRRLKKDIETLPYGLKEILQLQPKAYNWKNRKQTNKSLGLIAQDVQTIIKEVVTIQDNEQKTLGVSYTELIPILIKAIQEQQKIITNSEVRISNYENEVSSLQSTVSNLNIKLEAFNDLNNRLEKIEASQYSVDSSPLAIKVKN